MPTPSMPEYLPVAMSDLDSARREAIRALCQAQANDHLTVEGFESRLDQVRHAPNEATLAAILADLDGLVFPPAITGCDPRNTWQNDRCPLYPLRNDCQRRNVGRSIEVFPNR